MVSPASQEDSQHDQTELDLYLFTVGSLLSRSCGRKVPSRPRDQRRPPIFRVTVVERTTNAVSYRHRSGWTKVDLHGTPLAPDATGHADVNSRPGLHRSENRDAQAAARVAVRSRVSDLRAVGDHSGRALQESGRSGVGWRQLASGRHHGSAGVRADRDRRAVFRRHPAERRRGDGKRGPPGHARQDRADQREVRSAEARHLYHDRDAGTGSTP